MTVNEVIISLIRAALLDIDTKSIGEADLNWDSIMDVAISQNVVAIVWDGICKLPLSHRPPRLQSINWGLSAQEVKDSYMAQQRVLGTLLDICKKNGIRLLLLKGVELSELYPNPPSRSCADIDIYLFEDYEKGNYLLKPFLDREIGKHSTIYIDGIMIENHNNFLDPNTPQKRKILEYINSSLSSVVLTDKGYYVLPTIANLVFLTFHTIKHFLGGKTVPIRNILDFALFLNSNKERISPKECNEVLESLNLVKGFEMLVCFSEMVLQFDFMKFHFGIIPNSDIAEFKRILYNKDFSVPCTDSHVSCVKLRKDPDTFLLSKYLPRNYSIKQKYVPIIVSFIRKIFFISKGDSVRTCLSRRLKLK